jgi:hypothetical protein
MKMCEIMEEETQYTGSSDSGGKTLEGGNNYKLHLPANIPAKNFWSVIVYDYETRLIIRNDQLWPSIYSTRKSLVINQDGSVDILFGPSVPAGREKNWIQTVPGKGWYMILRIYGTMESWFDKTWRPGEIEHVN